MQTPPIVSSGPTVSEKVKIDDYVEVISVRSASTKRSGNGYYFETCPVHAQDLEIFKADMISRLADMLQSSLSKSGSGCQGQSESSQNVTSDQEKAQLDHADHSEGGNLASVEDPTENLGDPKWENLMMMDDEERDFESFALASSSVTKR